MDVVDLFSLCVQTAVGEQEICFRNNLQFPQQQGNGSKRLRLGLENTANALLDKWIRTRTEGF